MPIGAGAEAAFIASFLSNAVPNFISMFGSVQGMANGARRAESMIELHGAWNARLLANQSGDGVPGGSARTVAKLAIWQRLDNVVHGIHTWAARADAALVNGRSADVPVRVLLNEPDLELGRKCEAAATAPSTAGAWASTLWQAPARGLLAHHYGLVVDFHELGVRARVAEQDAVERELELVRHVLAQVCLIDL